MYISHLNFLSTEKRRLLQKMLYMQFFKGVLEIFLGIFSLATIILLGGQWIVEMYFGTLATSLTYLSQEHNDSQRQIQAINATLKRTDTIQSHYTLWTTNLQTLFAAVPDAVVLDSLSVDATEKTYILTGTAATRDDLLAFRDRLQAIDYVKAIDIPISQFTTRFNLPFSLTITLK